MPYITQDRRKLLDPSVEALQKKLGELSPRSTGKAPKGMEGDLNYVISRLIGAAFLNDTRYHTIARVTGVLDNVKAEFYRRLGVPYENEAIEKNGDIPEFERTQAMIDGQARERISKVVTGSKDAHQAVKRFSLESEI